MTAEINGPKTTAAYHGRLKIIPEGPDMVLRCRERSPFKLQHDFIDTSALKWPKIDHF